ncbi:hypothetical protein [Vampirovibrio chlorellavorus]|uniref:hypothetical protein n=1 Tax=Vampirovibrio chlorellavorus TaxID=758823 RepID=UPI0026EB5B10|nr:hypothetical protein [Vampirovibrio chlorellavorus]
MEIRHTRCPNCGKLSVVTQDIEVLCDSALLVKLENRIQRCCQQCGWMDFLDIDLDNPPSAASTTHR